MTAATLSLRQSDVAHDKRQYVWGIYEHCIGNHFENISVFILNE